MAKTTYTRAGSRRAIKRMMNSLVKIMVSGHISTATFVKVNKELERVWKGLK